MIVYAHFDHIEGQGRFIDIFKAVNQKYSLNLETGPWVAGGAVESMVRGMMHGHLNNHIRDVDLFYPTSSPPRLGEKESIEYRGFETVLVDVVGYKQFANLQALFDDFDFTCAKWATDGRVIVADSQKTIDHTQDRILDMDRDTDRPNAFRLSRYLTKGYTPTPKVIRAKLAEVKIEPNGYIDIKQNEY